MTELFRKRLIPDECIHLDGDRILYHDDGVIITRWETLHPKDTFAWGISCYVPGSGYKISKFFKSDNSPAYIYCDIIDTYYDAVKDSYIFTDLLADVIIENDGRIRVVDIDELADAFDGGIISHELLSLALRRLDSLLSLAYSGDISRYTKLIDKYVFSL